MNVRNQRHDDRGATLILVLIVMSVMSAVMSVVLASTDTGQRSTVQLRDQSSNNYAADGAAQAVLNKLRTAGLNCANPSATTAVTLGSTPSAFYSPASSEQGPINAYAQCTPDGLKGTTVSTNTPPPSTTVRTVTPSAVTSTGTALGAGDATLPSYAILTTGSTSSDYGLDFSPSSGNTTFCVLDGSIGSNASVNASKSGEVLAVALSSSVPSSGANANDCTKGSGVSSSGSKLVVNAANQCQGGTFTPTSCAPGSAQISYPAAPTVQTTGVSKDPAPLCKTVGNGNGNQTTYAAFKPGYYTSSTQLSTPCGTAANTIVEWLTPGTYFFDYSTSWQWPTTLIAGTPETSTSGGAVPGLNANNASTLDKLANAQAAPGSCQDPASLSNVQGAQLVFGGASIVSASRNTVAEVCASSPSGAPPVAIWGLAGSLGVTLTDNSTVTIAASSVCGATCTACSPSSCGSNSLISSTPSGQLVMYLRGYVYAPTVQISVTLKNSVGQVFNWGVIVRDLQITMNGASPTNAFARLPRPNTGVGVITTTSTPPPYATTSVTQPPTTTSTSYSIRYVNVWTCTVASLRQAGLSACPTNGPANVQARVLVNPSGQLTVLSWNHVR